MAFFGPPGHQIGFPDWESDPSKFRTVPRPTTWWQEEVARARREGIPVLRPFGTLNPSTPKSVAANRIGFDPWLGGGDLPKPFLTREQYAQMLDSSPHREFPREGDAAYMTEKYGPGRFTWSSRHPKEVVWKRRAKVQLLGQSRETTSPPTALAPTSAATTSSTPLAMSTPVASPAPANAAAVSPNGFMDMLNQIFKPQNTLGISPSGVSPYGGAATPMSAAVPTGSWGAMKNTNSLVPDNTELLRKFGEMMFGSRSAGGAATRFPAPTGY